MTHIIRGAQVQFIDNGEDDWGHGKDYDVVEILDNGALRVAQVWQGARSVGWCEVETSAAYFPPGSWSRVTPRHHAGSLFVEDEHVSEHTSRAVEGGLGSVTRLGLRVRPDEAHRLAVDYLVDNYQQFSRAEAEDNVREHLPGQGMIRVTQPPAYHGDTDTERAIRFIFVNTAPQQ